MDALVCEREAAPADVRGAGSRAGSAAAVLAGGGSPARPAGPEGGGPEEAAACELEGGVAMACDPSGARDSWGSAAEPQLLVRDTTGCPLACAMANGGSPSPGRRPVNGRSTRACRGLASEPQLPESGIVDMRCMASNWTDG